MDETTYARAIAEDLKSEGISSEEWKVIKDEYKDKLKEKEPYLDVEEVMSKIGGILAGMVAKEIRKEIEEIKGDITEELVERKKVLTELKKEAPEAFNGYKKIGRIPRYFLGDYKDVDGTIIFEVKKPSDEYEVKIEKEMLKSAIKKFKSLGDPITPYRVKREMDVSNGQSKGIIVYLWKEGILKANGYTKSKRYDSINFRLEEGKVPDELKVTVKPKTDVKKNKKGSVALG